MLKSIAPVLTSRVILPPPAVVNEENTPPVTSILGLGSISAVQ